MSARAWQQRRPFPLLEVVLTGAEFGEPLQYRVIPRVELARTRRLEQLARRRARRQGRRFDTWAFRGWAWTGQTSQPWSNVDHDIVADLRAAGLNGLARSIVETPPL